MYHSSPWAQTSEFLKELIRFYNWNKVAFAIDGGVRKPLRIATDLSGPMQASPIGYAASKNMIYPPEWVNAQEVRAFIYSPHNRKIRRFRQLVLAPITTQWDVWEAIEAHHDAAVMQDEPEAYLIDQLAKIV
jgi:hypothetical protein